MMNIRKLLFFLFAVIAIGVGLYPLMYFLFDMSGGLLSTKTIDLLSSKLWTISFYGHIVFGGIALLTGWSQFSRSLRKRRLDVHRNLGKIYLAAVGLSGLSGLYIAQYATGGIGTMFGFSVLATLWLWSTTKAYLAVRSGNILGHQRWMIRSYALTFAAVTLRIWLPLLIIWYQGEFIPAYQIVAWLSWIPNILMAEWLITKVNSVPVEL